MKVLIPVDSSEHAERAYDFYVKNFHKPDHTVLVLHINDPPRLPTLSFVEGGSFPADEISKIMTEHNKKNADLENNYTVKSTQQKIKSKVIMRVNEGGNAGEKIVQVAKEEGADMVVMGSRGLGTIRRTFLGSVSDFVVHHAKIPVMVVPKQ